MDPKRLHPPERIDLSTTSSDNVDQVYRTMLRDQFAGLIAASLVRNIPYEHLSKRALGVARSAYEVADALLHERTK